MNTCRHIKRLTLLLHQLQMDGLVSSKEHGWDGLDIAEIGGGNGNMARLVAKALGFHQWTIFDFPVMADLQEWYLKRTLAPIAVARNPVAAKTATDTHRVRLVDTEHLWQHLHHVVTTVADGFTWDALVASHSWSELPMDTFHMYFAALSERVRYIL